MSLFGKSKNYIGVDLGTSALKMVELQNKSGRAVLTTYGYVEQSTDIVRSSSAEMEQKIIKVPKKWFIQAEKDIFKGKTEIGQRIIIPNHSS